MAEGVADRIFFNDTGSRARPAPLMLCWSRQVMMIYKSYMEKKALLEAQLSRERAAIAAVVLAEIQQCIQEFGFTRDELFPDGDGVVTRKRRAKYLNPQTGETWSGVGKEPRWLRGKDRAQFALGAGLDENHHDTVELRPVNEES
jgi:DNA-binding protein H-NS